MTTSTPSSPSRTVTVFALAALCLIWGSTWLVIGGGLEHLAPFTAAAARMAVAAVAMTLAAPSLASREGGSRPPLWLSAIVGSTQLGYSYAVVYWSETRLPSGLASLIWSVFPMLMAISGNWFLQGERLARAQWLGFLLGSAGMVVLFAKDLNARGEGATFAGWVLLTSPLSAAISNTLVKKYGARQSSVLLNRDALWFAAAFLSGLALVFERDAKNDWNAGAIASVVYLALVATACAFGLYFWLMRTVAAHRMSLISYVNPAIALFLGWALGGEVLTPATWVGSLLILAGVVLVVRGHGSRR